MSFFSWIEVGNVIFVEDKNFVELVVNIFIGLIERDKGGLIYDVSKKLKRFGVVESCRSI